MRTASHLLNEIAAEKCLKMNAGIKGPVDVKFYADLRSKCVTFEEDKRKVGHFFQGGWKWLEVAGKWFTKDELNYVESVVLQVS